MHIGEVFNEISEEYTANMIRWLPYYRQMLTSVVDAIEGEKGYSRILDLGCGDGNLTYLLSKRFPDAKITLVDASDQMLKNCQKRFLSADHQYVLGFFQEIEFEVHSFDLIAAALSIHHLTGKEKMVLYRNVHKWLDEKGLFVFTDLLIEKSDHEHPEFLNEWKKGALEGGSSIEDWNYLMEHYDRYDHPSSLSNHLTWLQASDFSRAECVWAKGHWATVRAIR